MAETIMCGANVLAGYGKTRGGCSDKAAMGCYEPGALREIHPTRHYAKLFVLDNRFEEEARAVSGEVLFAKHGKRLYALTTPLSYRGKSMVFAIPLRSNIRWDTPTKWYVPITDRSLTRQGNHHGFDCSKMLPVCREVVGLYRWHDSPLLAQFELVGRYEQLIEKAQAYLFVRESKGTDNMRETDIDAIIDSVIPKFSLFAA